MTVRLDLINSMLATTGTAKLSAADIYHPDYLRANSVLVDVLDEFAAKPLWYNTVIRELTANNNGRVVVPSNAISCDPIDISLDYAIRGQYLFDLTNYTDVIGAGVVVKCIIQMSVPIEDMPPVALQYIRAAARFQYFLDKDGSDKKIQIYGAILQNKELELNALNMKHTDANFFLGSGNIDYRTRRSGITGRYYNRIE